MERRQRPAGVLTGPVEPGTDPPASPDRHPVIMSTRPVQTQRQPSWPVVSMFQVRTKPTGRFGLTQLQQRLALFPDSFCRSTQCRQYLLSALCRVVTNPNPLRRGRPLSPPAVERYLRAHRPELSQRGLWLGGSAPADRYWFESPGPPRGSGARNGLWPVQWLWGSGS